MGQNSKAIYSKAICGDQKTLRAEDRIGRDRYIIAYSTVTDFAKFRG